MREVAIRAEELSKQFRIGQLRGYDTLRDTVARAAAAVVRGRPPDPESRMIWALRDVSFEAREGEIIGLIGRNGAGKTTLLRILSRIMTPTGGYADVYGRVGSLLEVGTGFHPELTGRENVFLNGAILGMRRREIALKFDEIVEFAGVAKFIDTPVKRFSSGMYVRLAFAVAAFMETDILLVDEVLAVGDAEFQKRSIGAMRDVTEQQGRTVLFVSHNMASIKALCQRALLLRNGSVVADGPVDDVTAEYLSGVTAATSGGLIAEDAQRLGNGDARYVAVELLDRAGQPVSAATLGQPLTVRAKLSVIRPVPDAVFEVGISTGDGIRVCTSFSIDGPSDPVSIEPGELSVSLDFEEFLLPGRYAVDLVLATHSYGRTVDYVERVLEFEVMNVAAEGADRYPFATRRGYVRPRGTWTLSVDPNEP